MELKSPKERGSIEERIKNAKNVIPRPFMVSVQDQETGIWMDIGSVMSPGPIFHEK